MNSIDVKPAGKCAYDLIALGEVMLRFDPGEGRVRTAREFKEWDGVGRAARNGLNFTERGFGVRGACGIPDRGHTATSQTKPGDFDWDKIFGQLGARWFHTGGIFAGLSETTPKLALEAMQAARKHGTVVSCDLNYRP